MDGDLETMHLMMLVMMLMMMVVVMMLMMVMVIWRRASMMTARGAGWGSFDPCDPHLALRDSLFISFPL